jgi:hypothetical protein
MSCLAHRVRLISPSNRKLNMNCIQSAFCFTFHNSNKSKVTEMKGGHSVKGKVAVSGLFLEQIKYFIYLGCRISSTDITKDL